MKATREISFLVNMAELKLLHDIIIDEEIEDCIRNARTEKGMFRLKFSYEELDSLADFIAAESNHNRSKKRQDKLDELYDKVTNLLNLSSLVKHYGRTKIISKKKSIRGTKKIYIFDIYIDSLDARKKPLRTLAISGNATLYNFAKNIVKAFDFYFDHCLGFYTNFERLNNSRKAYELFVDIGEGHERGIKGVKKTKVSQVFEYIGEKMLFLFDYGDNWHFIVQLKEIRAKLPGESLPLLLKSIGESPVQYPPCEEEIEENDR